VIFLTHSKLLPYLYRSWFTRCIVIQQLQYHRL